MKISEHPRLNRALHDYFAVAPTERTTIEDRIWNTFGQKQAVVVIDMANFSLITHEKGIVYYLTLIQQMQSIVEKQTVAFDGVLVKFSADNAFMLFDETKRGVDCLIKINNELRAHNLATSQIWDVEICAGVCFGNILNINNNDIFGEPVNTSARLGEDIAKPYEILLSEKALEQLTDEYLQQHKVEKRYSERLNDHYYCITCE